jgi:hypothetical protein
MPVNTLYLAVLPIVHLGTNLNPTGFGLTQQILTLFPDRKLATEFFPDEVDAYLSTFEDRAENYLVGGHVLRYEFFKEPTQDGRIVIGVVQHVR